MATRRRLFNRDVIVTNQILPKRLDIKGSNLLFAARVMNSRCSSQVPLGPISANVRLGGKATDTRHSGPGPKIAVGVVPGDTRSLRAERDLMLP